MHRKAASSLALSTFFTLTAHFRPASNNVAAAGTQFKMPVSTSPELDAQQQFLRDVRHGLASPPRTLPCKYFYDQRGSLLFDEICALDEYYLTRTESLIMERWLDEIADWDGEPRQLIEFGSGSSTKTRLLLEKLPEGSQYIPIDISRDHLLQTSEDLRRDFPSVELLPLVADFTELDDLPFEDNSDCPRVVYFPGSTIGNFSPAEAVGLLQRMAQIAGANGTVVIGVDQTKPLDVLLPAYNDDEGVTAAFNLNLLDRINRELPCEIPVSEFSHEAHFNAVHGRIEMHLVTQRDVTLVIGGEETPLAAGESIHTENSYKYSPERFAGIARAAGLEVIRRWTDDDNYFSVQCLSRIAR